MIQYMTLELQNFQNSSTWTQRPEPRTSSYRMASNHKFEHRVNHNICSVLYMHITKSFCVNTKKASQRSKDKMKGL